MIRILKYEGLFLAIILGIGSNSLAFEKKIKSTNQYNVEQAEPRTIAGMTLVWNDEFNTDGLPDSTNWDFEYGFVRNRELQWYQPQNAVCKDGRLLIQSKKEQVTNARYNPSNGDWRTSRPYSEYTSACLITKGLHDWESPAYFEIRALIDTSMGSWPAIWLLGTEDQWPANGEIDIMEFYRINNEPTILANLAWGTEKRYVAKWDSKKKPLTEFLKNDHEWPQKFHVWAMKWDNQKIQLIIDGELINETSIDQTFNPDGNNPFSMNKRFYLLLNLALGGNGGDPSDSKFPITFEIDYVRVYKIDE